MEKWIVDTLIITALAVASGVLGRLGGAGKSGAWYDGILDTKWRDVGCSLIIALLSAHYTGWQASFWWAYLLIFLLHWGAFSTYWDRIFKYDCMWFSGLVAGVALLPIIFINKDLIWIVVGRAVVLSIVWEALNRLLPGRVLIWRRDVAEEFSRYAVSL